jgi:uncharacterized protein (DUF1800 family)
MSIIDVNRFGHAPEQHLKIEAVIAANRFGLGARPGESGRTDRGPSSWLIRQVQGPSRIPAAIAELPTSAAALVDVQKIREMCRDSRQPDSDEPAADIVEQYGKAVRQNNLQQAQARYVVAASTDHPFHERLVHFGDVTNPAAE